MPEQQAAPWWLYLVPNVLSGVRLGLALAFPFVSPRFWLIVIIVAGFSDLADGWIARRFRLQTWIGGLLDATADKAFVLVVLGALLYEQYLAWWQVLAVLPRDIVVGGIALYAVSLRRWDAFQRMPSRIFGKLTTMFMFALLVLAAALPDHDGLVLVFVVLTAVCSALAAFDYFVKSVRGAREAPDATSDASSLTSDV